MAPAVASEPVPVPDSAGLDDTVGRARALFGPLRWDDRPVSGDFVLPIGTVTLLLADIEGSTRGWERDPEAMADAVQHLDAALVEIIGAHEGVRPVEQGEGDSFVVAFARASDGVACALALQTAMRASPLRLRLGLHTGEVQLRDDGNYVGPAINRAARLRDAAHGGQTVMSQATYELVRDRVPDACVVADLGVHRLRDLGRPEHIFQLGHPDLDEHFPLVVRRPGTGAGRAREARRRDAPADADGRGRLRKDAPRARARGSPPRRPSRWDVVRRSLTRHRPESHPGGGGEHARRARPTGPEARRRRGRTAGG
jgi:class 3 adenylate cyclase